jgi:parvulin-like peptidyl-prolyl isomerase
VEAAAFQLRPGQLSDIVVSERGYHIIEAIDRQPAGVIPFDEAKERIRSKLAIRERQARISDYLDKLKQTARIERLL